MSALAKVRWTFASEERPKSYARRALAERTFVYVSTGSAENRHLQPGITESPHTLAKVDG